MGVFDKFLDIMKLNDDDYDDDFYDEEDEYFDDEEFDEKPARRSLFGKKNTKEESFDDFDMEEEKKFQPASCKQGDSDETSCIQKGWKYGSLCCKTKFC